MHTFTDKAGRRWEIAIHTPAIKRVRALLDVDLMDAIGGGLLARMGTDPVLLIDVLYALCEPQARAGGVSDVEFGEAFDGDVVEAAVGAFLDELLGFFRPAPRRLMKRALERGQALMDLGMRQATTALEAGQLDGPLRVAGSPAPTPGDSSTNAPASVGSTPEN